MGYDERSVHVYSYNMMYYTMGIKYICLVKIFCFVICLKPRDRILGNAALSVGIFAHLCTQTWSAGDKREKADKRHSNIWVV